MSDQVSVLVIEHEHGVDTFVCKAEEVAQKKLKEFVRYWWDTEFLETDANYRPVPEILSDEDIEEYFFKSGEVFEIHPAIVLED